MNGDYWSEDGLVFYHNGEGWAIHPTGITVCFCQEDSTIKILKHEIDVNTVKKDDQRENLNQNVRNKRGKWRWRTTSRNQYQHQFTSIRN